MRCPRCAHENPFPATVCAECAAALIQTCENCGRELCESADLRIMRVLTAPQLGYADARDGRIAEAVSTLEHALEQTVATGFFSLRSLVYCWLGEAFLRAGRLDEATSATQQALDISRTHGERGHHGWALRLLGEVRFSADSSDLNGVEAAYRQAMGLAGELGMLPLVADCHLGLGKLYCRTGQRENAREQLAAATTMYRVMGMTYWLEGAEAEVR